VPVDVDRSEDPAGGKLETTSSRRAESSTSKFFQDENNNYLIRAHAPTALARLLVRAPRR
jgi:hypothetical protein